MFLTQAVNGYSIRLESLEDAIKEGFALSFFRLLSLCSFSCFILYLDLSQGRMPVGVLAVFGGHLLQVINIFFNPSLLMNYRKMRFVFVSCNQGAPFQTDDLTSLRFRLE